MRHERWRRLSAQVMRESGRVDPLIDREGVWTAGERIGEWGLSRSAAAAQARMATDYQRRRDAIVRGHANELREFDRQWQRHRDRINRKNEGRDRHLHMEVSPECVITFVDGTDKVEMSRFIGKRRDFFDERRTKKRGEHAATILINGDGFDLPLMQRLQAELRQDYQREFGLAGVMVVPYQALSAAGIRLPTIKRIAVVRDGGENVVVRLEGPAAKDVEKAVEEGIRRAPASSQASRYWQTSFVEFHSRGNRYQVRHNSNDGHPRRDVQIWRQPLDGVPTWNLITTNKELGWHVTEWRHRLGASVFSAVDGSGVRHRFLSAFDMQETPPLYFLAQLPDEGKVLDYNQALDALAPPIVHQARRDGKLVYRQGDVFFVQTELTRAQLRKQKAVIYTGMGRGRHSTRPKRGRNIYLTGHLATSVAVLPNGVTFAQGVVTHFPQINDPSRTTADHRPLTLGGTHWYLCLRNTVPRVRAAEAVVEEEEGGGTNARINIAA